MKAGDLVRLNEVLKLHPAYKNRVLFIVKRVLGPYKAIPASQLVELYTIGGKVVAYNSLTLELL